MKNPLKPEEAHKVANDFFENYRPLEMTFFQLVKYARSIVGDVLISFNKNKLEVIRPDFGFIFYVTKDKNGYSISFANSDTSIPLELSSEKFSATKELCKEAAIYLKEHSKDSSLEHIDNEAIEDIVENDDVNPDIEDTTDDETVNDETDSLEIEYQFIPEARKVFVYAEANENAGRSSRKAMLLDSFIDALSKYKARICVAILVVTIATFCIYKSTIISISQELRSLEYGKEYTVEELVKTNRKGTALSISEYGQSFSSNKLGPCKLSFVAKKGKKTVTETFEFTVIDATPPVINGDNEVSLEQFSSTRSIIDNYKVTDNCDKSLSSGDITLSDTINTYTRGKYAAQLTVKDSSDNTAVKDITVNVVERDDGTIEASDAGDYIGQDRGVIGFVCSISYRPDVNGQPTFINLSDNYPATDGMQIVIWGEYRSSDMIRFLEDLEEGSVIAVRGGIKEYYGIPEMIVYSVNQMELISNPKE